MPGLDLLQADSLSALLLASALKGAFVLVAALFATRFMVSAAASVRHAVLTLAFMAGLLMPLLLVAVPGWAIPILPEGGVSLGFSDPVALNTSYKAALSGAAGVQSGSPGPVLSIGMLLVLFWCLGALFVAARWGVGVLSALVLIRKSSPLSDDEWGGAISHASSVLSLRRKVRVRTSPYIRTPMTWGVFRPVVLLPEEALRWSPERRAAVAMHELAHVCRFDSLSQVFVQAACAFHWFNPFVWVAYQRFLIEREHACDDYVLNQGALPSSYAEHLLDIAKGLRKEPRAAFAMAPMAQRSQIEERLRSILNNQQRRDRLSRGLLIAVCVLVFALVWPLAAVNFVEKVPEASDQGFAVVLDAVPEAPAAVEVAPIVPVPAVPLPPESPAPAPEISNNSGLGTSSDGVVWEERVMHGPAASPASSPRTITISADVDHKRRLFQSNVNAALAYEIQIDTETSISDADVEQIIVRVDNSWNAHADETRNVVRQVEALARGAAAWESSEWIEDQAETLVVLEEQLETEWTASWKNELSRQMVRPTVNPERIGSDRCTTESTPNPKQAAVRTR